MATERSDARERTIPELLRDLSDETATLVRQELQLARVELAETIEPLTASATAFGATAVFALGAFGAITTALIAALSLALEVWAAALIVAVVYLIVAIVLAQRGRERLAALRRPLIPRTVATVKEDVAWIKTQHNSAEK
jgi:uncharacterized membrane protein YqjE